MLSAIVAVTLVVPDIDRVERAYRRELSYEVVEHGRVRADTAATWGTDRLTGHPFVILRPASREPVYLRFVEDRTAARPALRTLGWNATEILVQDPPELARRLAGSPFRIIGPPAPLDVNPAVVAMQAAGPAGETLYFTRIPPGGSKFRLGSATSFVDRVFIVVLGAHDLRRTLEFYSNSFGVPVTEPALSRIGVLADAWGLPADHRFALALVRLPERFLVEVDEYPTEAAAPDAARGSLPGGMAMVSFAVDSLDAWADRLVAPPRSLRGPPYSGARAGVLRGPDGELVELIEMSPHAAAAGAAPSSAAQPAAASSRQR